MSGVALWRRLLAELLGSAFLAAVVIGSGIAAQRLSPGDTGLELLENAAVNERPSHPPPSAPTLAPRTSSRARPVSPTPLSASAACSPTRSPGSPRHPSQLSSPPK